MPLGLTGASPMGLAPPFRDLSQRYPIETLAEALAEGIVTGHPAMPHFTFHPREIDALLTYIDGLTRSCESLGFPSVELCSLRCTPEAAREVDSGQGISTAAPVSRPARSRSNAVLASPSANCSTCV